MKEKILTELKIAEEDIEAWEGINKHLWKRAYIKKRDLLIELDKLKDVPLDKHEPVEKPFKPVFKKQFDATDVNKDGKTDLSDIIAIGKKIISKKPVRKSIRRKKR